VNGEPPARPPGALYVHIPFCLSVCPYCDFVVLGGKAARGAHNRLAGLVAGLITELQLRAAARRPPPRRAPMASVYLGGGTPSLLAAAQVAQLLAEVERCHGLAPDAEITLECNPGPADRGDLAGFRAAGVNRLSIGAQSMASAELRRLGRRHSAADVAATVRAARRAGFDNVGLDLLYDVPTQTTDSWRHSLAGALELEPDHLSCYALALDGDHSGDDLLPLTAGAARWRRRARREQDEDRSAGCYEIADQMLSAAGLEWYELSNWARPGYQGAHNLGYWMGQPFEAVGPGAHAFDGALTRRWNAAHLDGYLAALEAGRLPPGGSETLDRPTALAELAILRLRTRAGLAAGQASEPVFRPALDWARRNGLLESAADGGVRLNLSGRLLSNEIFVRMLPEPVAAVA
jgi:oxygen-independent coproporphyrinogen III oxidase